jgi:uncharacterized protein (DUF1697 family)
MKPLIALFRGVNIMGRNRLPMKELAILMEEIGLGNVRTYIQSGNVVFETNGSNASRLAARIGDSIEEHFGFRPEVILLDRAALDEAIATNPFPEADSEPSTVHLTFLAASPENPDLDSLERLRAPSERFELAGRVFYLHAPDGIGRSKLAARIEKALGVPGTSRNWRTVLRLEEMIDEAD